MPKQKITKDMVVNAAFELARSGGMEQVLVKNIAARLGCSVQPIYSYCRNMDSLRQDVIQKTNLFLKEYLAKHIDPNDLFCSTGHAYVRLAKEEPFLFRLFILHERKGISSLEELYQSEANSLIAPAIAQQLGISIEQARQLHLHMLIYTTGIGTIFSVTTPGIPADDIWRQQEKAYQAFLSHLQKDTQSITDYQFKDERKTT